jgi:hypothetical protein
MNRRKDAFLAAAKMSPEIYGSPTERRGLHDRFLPNETGDRHQRNRRMSNRA